MQSKGVEIRLKTEVAEITQRNDQGVVIQTRPSSEDRDDDTTTSKSKTETFDELVMCVLADDALKLLGKTASRKEKFVLGGASFYDDITITQSGPNTEQQTGSMKCQKLNMTTQKTAPTK